MKIADLLGKKGVKKLAYAVGSFLGTYFGIKVCLWLWPPSGSYSFSPFHCLSPPLPYGVKKWAREPRRSLETATASSPPAATCCMGSERPSGG